MPTVRENGCWTATDSYIVCIRLNIKRKIQFIVFRVLLIDHGMCKQMNLSIVFAMNVMDVIQQYDQ
jgi:hypothetical protein